MSALKAAGIKSPNLPKEMQEKKEKGDPMIHLQRNLKNNSEDLRNFCDDLNDW